VLATDINPAWLDPRGTYEVRRHDVAADPPPEPGTFDLVHARLVLVHVPDRARALATMVAALRPGGWLLVEDADTELQPLVCLEETGPAQQRANRLRRAFRELMTHRGADLRYARTLPRTLREAAWSTSPRRAVSRSAGRCATVWRSRRYGTSAPSWSPPG